MLPNILHKCFLNATSHHKSCLDCTIQEESPRRNLQKRRGVAYVFITFDIYNALWNNYVSNDEDGSKQMSPHLTATAQATLKEWGFHKTSIRLRINQHFSEIWALNRYSISHYFGQSSKANGNHLPHHIWAEHIQSILLCIDQYSKANGITLTKRNLSSACIKNSWSMLINSLKRKENTNDRKLELYINNQYCIDQHFKAKWKQ